MNRGMSLLEVVIAAAILAVLLGAVYVVVFASTTFGEKEISLRDAQFQLQVRMDQMSKELRESAQTLIRVKTFSDAKMPTAAQTVLVFVSARDANEQFMSENARAQWQKLVVYAPYYNEELKTGELRRYTLSPVPVEFTDEANPPAILVTATEIHLGSQTISRNGGERLFMKFDFLKAEAGDNSISLELSIQGGTVLGKTVDLGSEVKGRN